MQRVISVFSWMAWLNSGAHFLLTFAWMLFCLADASQIERAAGGIALNSICGLLWGMFFWLCEGGRWLVEVTSNRRK